jgi:DME family drug/metabolite transporter
MTLRSDALTGIALVMLAAVLWATVGIAVQITAEAETIPDILLAALRTGIAGPALVMIWALNGRARMSGLRSLSLRPLTGFAIASAVFQICLFRCFDQLGVTVAVFLTVCLPPVLGWGWSALRGGKGLTRQSTFALVLAILGMALVSSSHGAPGQAISLAGLSNGVMASVAFVALSLAASDLARTSPAILVAGAGLSLSAVMLMAVAAVSGSLLIPPDLTVLSLARLGGLVVYLGLVPTALAYLCYCAGIARCRTAVTGLVASMIEPLLAALLASLLLGETVLPITAAGCAILLAAIVLLWQGERPPAPRIAEA